MAANVDTGKCVACGACEQVCPVEAIKVSDAASVDESVCIECGACVNECPAEAISLP
ncbi:MAG: 4Fe-4S binding protein [bacterium]|nr:4Fe-4S binding protein [bacterium]